MGRTSILYADSGIALGEIVNVFITVLHEPSTMARLREIRKHLARLQAKWPGMVCGLTVLGPTAFSMNISPEIRDESAALSRNFPSSGNAMVVEATGFAGSALRAFLSGVSMFSKARGKIHPTVAEAAAWLAPIASAAAKQPITAAEIIRAAEEARAAMTSGREALPVPR
jgi:hypothetical protein